ncbi:hypothetical protein [Allostreptomyces psammosilenae]|uniref:Uncharacterized protein n=1 Tax=Allostreptomyces psammosilenae TaxID=1892865 RepID=A0A853A0S8_9ACTN|nr:hypothetical protein [Allostreptomyces psammosilenae]NYI04421.1 hypothetical protein [Allostreptomyces psammosilenae]
MPDPVPQPAVALPGRGTAHLALVPDPDPTSPAAAASVSDTALPVPGAARPGPPEVAHPSPGADRAWPAPRLTAAERRALRVIAQRRVRYLGDRAEPERRWFHYWLPEGTEGPMGNRDAVLRNATVKVLLDLGLVRLGETIYDPAMWKCPVTVTPLGRQVLEQLGQDADAG